MKDLKITRVFDAPKELVFKAWTDPELAKKWWGPEHFTSPEIKIDLRVGGKYLLCMRGKPGPDMPETDFWSTGTYKEIIPNEKIVVLDSFSDKDGNVVPPTEYGMPETFPIESEIIITFKSLDDDKTEMTLYYPSIEGIEGEMLKNMTLGWNQSFDKLSAAVKEGK